MDFLNNAFYNKLFRIFSFPYCLCILQTTAYSLFASAYIMYDIIPQHLF